MTGIVEGLQIRLHPAWDYVATDEAVELWDARSGDRLRVTSGSRLGRAFELLARGLDAERVAADIADQTGMSLVVSNRLLRSLSERGVVYRATGSAHRAVGTQRTRTDPLLAFLARYESSSVSAEQYLARLRAATILVMGLGGFGSWIAQTLCMMGVGTLIGVDGDVVEESNLGRQALYRTEHVGREKALAMRDALAAVNPEVTFRALVKRVREPTDIAATLIGADLAVLPFSYTGLHPTRDLVARACVRYAVPFLPVGQQAVGPLWRDRSSACFRCLVDDPRTPSLQAYYTNNASGRVDDSTYLPWSAESAQRAADEVVRFLTGFLAPVSDNQLVICRSTDRTLSTLGGARNPACTICGPDRKGARDVAT